MTNKERNERYAEYRKKYYQERKNDPEFMAKQREKKLRWQKNNREKVNAYMRERYHKLKSIKPFKWISVEKELPTLPGVYLVFTTEMCTSLRIFVDSNCDGKMTFNDKSVTHWMPLPEAPKGGAE